MGNTRHNLDSVLSCQSLNLKLENLTDKLAWMNQMNNLSVENALRFICNFKMMMMATPAKAEGEENCNPEIMKLAYNLVTRSWLNWLQPTNMMMMMMVMLMMLVMVRPSSSSSP